MPMAGLTRSHDSSAHRRALGNQNIIARAQGLVEDSRKALTFRGRGAGNRFLQTHIDFRTPGNFNRLHSGKRRWTAAFRSVVRGLSFHAVASGNRDQSKKNKDQSEKLSISYLARLHRASLPSGQGDNLCQEDLMHDQCHIKLFVFNLLTWQPRYGRCIFYHTPDSPACKKIPQREISSLRFRRSETAFVHLRLERLRLKTFEIRAPI